VKNQREAADVISFPSKGKRFIPIPRAALRIKLRGQTRHLLEAICDNTKLTSGRCWLNDLGELATACGIKRRNVSRHVRELLGANLMIRRPDGSYLVVYDDSRILHQHQGETHIGVHIGNEDQRIGDEDQHIGNEDQHIGDEDQHSGDDDQHIGDEDRHTNVSRASKEDILFQSGQTHTQSACARGSPVIDQLGNEIEPPEPREDFERFWVALRYRRPDDPKAKARREFYRLVREGVDPQELIQAAERRSTSVPAEVRFVRHTWKWLHEGDWCDQEEGEPSAWSTSAKSNAFRDFLRAHENGPVNQAAAPEYRAFVPDWKTIVDRWVEFDEWDHALGPRPDQPGCRMPEGRLASALIKRKRQRGG